MAYILTDGSNNIVTYPYSVGLLRGAYPNISFPAVPTDALLAEWNVFPVNSTTVPSINTLTQTVSEGTPVFVTDHWEQTWVVDGLPPEEQDAILAQFEESAQSTAASLLDATNKYVVESLTQGLALSPELIAYRAALADPSSLPGYPNEVVWPVAPSEPFAGAGVTEVGGLQSTGDIILLSPPSEMNAAVSKSFVDNAVLPVGAKFTAGPSALTGNIEFNDLVVNNITEIKINDTPVNAYNIQTSLTAAMNGQNEAVLTLFNEADPKQKAVFRISEINHVDEIYFSMVASYLEGSTVFDLGASSSYIASIDFGTVTGEKVWRTPAATTWKILDVSGAKQAYFFIPNPSGEFPAGFMENWIDPAVDFGVPTGELRGYTIDYHLFSDSNGEFGTMIGKIIAVFDNTEDDGPAVSHMYTSSGFGLNIDLETPSNNWETDKGLLFKRINNTDGMIMIQWSGKAFYSPEHLG